MFHVEPNEPVIDVSRETQFGATIREKAVATALGRHDGYLWRWSRCWSVEPGAAAALAVASELLRSGRMSLGGRRDEWCQGPT